MIVQIVQHSEKFLRDRLELRFRKPMSTRYQRLQRLSRNTGLRQRKPIPGGSGYFKRL